MRLQIEAGEADLKTPVYPRSATVQIVTISVRRRTEEGARQDRGPREARVLLGLGFQIGDEPKFCLKRGADLLSRFVLGVAPKLARQESLDAGLDGGVDDLGLFLRGHGVDRGHDGILTLEGVGEGGCGVVGLDNLDIGGEGGFGFRAREDGDVEVGVEQAFEDARTQISSGLS